MMRVLGEEQSMDKVANESTKRSELDQELLVTQDQPESMEGN